jgi:hypothetical protein
VRTRLFRVGIVLALLVGVLVAGAKPAAAALIEVDENGHAFSDGVPLGFTFRPDFGPGGLGLVLTYFLPFVGLQGDVLMQDGDVTQDVLRFNGDSTLVFYSDDIDGIDAFADTLALPSAFYPRQVTIPDVGPEGDNGAFYTPNDAQPGFNPTFVPTYHFISDGEATPEPSTRALTGLEMLGWSSGCAEGRRRADQVGGSTLEGECLRVLPLLPSGLRPG